jgi:hypothetical protein
MHVLIFAIILQIPSASPYRRGKKLEKKLKYSKAFLQYNLGCNEKKGIACAQIGRMYKNGMGRKINVAKALKFFMKACRLKYAEACGNAYSLHTQKLQKLLLDGCKGKSAKCCELLSKTAKGVTALKWKKKAIKLYKKKCKRKEGTACWKVSELIAVYEGEDFGGGPPLINRKVVQKYVRLACKYNKSICDKWQPITVNGLQSYQLEQERHRIGSSLSSWERQKERVKNRISYIRKWKKINKKWKKHRTYIRMKNELRVKKNGLKVIKKQYSKYFRELGKLSKAEARMSRLVTKRAARRSKRAKRRIRNLKKQCKAQHYTACFKLGESSNSTNSKIKNYYKLACMNNHVKACEQYRVRFPPKVGCTFLRKTLQSMAKKRTGNYKKLLDQTFSSSARQSFKKTAKSMLSSTMNWSNDASCRKVFYCKLARMPYWAWADQASSEQIILPPSFKKIPKNAIQIVTASTKQGSMGGDSTIFPPQKIVQMKNTRIGCKANLKVKVNARFSGYVTFHFWKNKCKYSEKQGKPYWSCNGQSRLDSSDYTQTIYVSPKSNMPTQNENKGKSRYSRIAGDPGTYYISVWANNPKRSKVFGMHRVFSGKELIKVKQHSSFNYCPANTADVFNNGCACIGFVPNKITVTVHPEPFIIPEHSRKKFCKSN